MFENTKEIYLKIKNETKIKIKRIRVEDSGHGFESSRSGNFNNESIEPTYYITSSAHPRDSQTLF